jgi:glycine/D-amino acid oxidase-like deaminating enzyme
MARERILILGAGLQGCAVALLLQRAGHAVTLVDRADGPLRRASLRNEGKIHLGFIFVNDPTFTTPLLMLRGALAFAPVLDQCAGAPLDWPALVSRPFTYVVPEGSMVPPDELAERYRRVDRAHAELLADDPRANYLGRRHRSLLAAPAARAELADRRVARTFATEELALDLVALRARLEPLLARRVECHYQQEVEHIERTAAGFRVRGRSTDGRPWAREAGVVVNCLWDGRLAIDRELGLLPTRPWVYRLKYRLMGHLPDRLADLPSLSFVLGRYGDAVVYRGGRLYLSWYPECLRGWSAEVAPPADWRGPCAGQVDAAVAAEISARTLAGLGELVPGLERSSIDLVDAGVIFSWGATDIDDPESELHRRSEIGVHAADGYYSIDPGKLTCAPLFAAELAARVGGA